MSTSRSRCSKTFSRSRFIATITPAGRALAEEATDALNQADFGLPGLAPGQAAELTESLHRIRDLVGDL